MAKNNVLSAILVCTALALPLSAIAATVEKKAPEQAKGKAAAAQPAGPEEQPPEISFEILSAAIDADGLSESATNGENQNQTPGASPGSPVPQGGPAPNKKVGDSIMLGTAGKRTGQPAFPPASLRQTDKPLPPDQYYQLVIERQKLMISSNKHILRILEAHRYDPLSARKDLLRHEREKEIKSQMLFRKYGTTPEQYYRSTRGSETQKERARYLDQHPEVRDEIAANSAELRALESRVWSRMTPLWTQRPPPAQPPR